MILAHKIARDPHDVQETYFRKAVGTARFVYNWALAEWQRQDAAWKADDTVSKPSGAVPKGAALFDAPLRRHITEEMK
jgi:putative transposase